MSRGSELAQEPRTTRRILRVSFPIPAFLDIAFCKLIATLIQPVAGDAEFSLYNRSLCLPLKAYSNTRTVARALNIEHDVESGNTDIPSANLIPSLLWEGHRKTSLWDKLGSMLNAWECSHWPVIIPIVLTLIFHLRNFRISRDTPPLSHLRLLILSAQFIRKLLSFRMKWT